MKWGYGGISLGISVSNNAVFPISFQVKEEMKYRNEVIKYIEFGRSQARGIKFGKGYLEAIKRTELILPKVIREE